MTESIRPLGPEVRRCVEDYLERVDRALAQRSSDDQQRRHVVEELRAQITEMLTARSSEALSTADVQAVLSQLDPPEAYASEVPPPVDDAASDLPQRLPRSAVLGAILVPLPFAAAFLFFTQYQVRQTTPPASVLPVAFRFIPWTVLVFAALSPLATTVLGVQAIGEIRRSRGRLYGLTLALFDALLYPLIAADVLISILCTFVCFAIYRANWLSEDSSKAWAVIASVVFCVAADFWIARLSWRSARR